MTNAERIKAMRQFTGLSAKKFGDKFGIPMRTIQDWERGERNAPDYVINLIKYALEVERIIPMVYVFEAHRSQDEIGTVKWFMNEFEALDYAYDAWNELDEDEQNSYKEDSAGTFGVYLYRCEWSEEHEMFMPVQSWDETWSAF